jgi:phage terminase large subunit-like protein
VKAEEAIGHYRRIAERYARDVASGEIPACKWIQTACQQTLDDFKGDERSPFRFDEMRAFRACAFIESMPHVKGAWASRGERLRLSPWQVWITASLFGWVHRDTGRRRYRRALVLVPRKNGKSAWAAALGLYMLAADGEHGAEIFAGATSEKQAMEVFRPARQMALKTPRLVNRFSLEIGAKSIVSTATGSRFEAVIGKPGDGASPSCAIIDEYHEHETDELVETMRTGQGARDEPILLMVTTAGDNVSGPCHAVMKDAEAMLSGNAKDEAFFAALYGLDEGDDWTTDAALIKANPNYGISVSSEFLRQERDHALANARRQAVFKTKHLNQWVGARSAFFNMENWRRCADEKLSLADFEGAPCYVGLDLASKQDITATVLLFPHDDRYAVFGRYYLPEAALNGRNRERYAELHRQRRLIIAGDAMIDQDRIQDDILDDLKRFDVRTLSFDPWNAGALIARLMDRGANCVEFHKTTKNVSSPMKTLAGLIDEKRIAHDGDEALAWMLSNVVTREDTSGNVRPVKAQPDSKIDAADALIAALAVRIGDEAAGIGREPMVFVA